MNDKYLTEDQIKLSLQKKYQDTYINVNKEKSIKITCPDGTCHVNRAFLKDTALDALYKNDCQSDIPVMILNYIIDYLSCSERALKLDLSFNDLILLYIEVNGFQLLDYLSYLKGQLIKKFNNTEHVNEIIEIAYNDNTEGKIFNFLYVTLFEYCMNRFSICFDNSPACITCVNKYPEFKKKHGKLCCHGEKKPITSVYSCKSYAYTDRCWCCIHNTDGRKKIAETIGKITLDKNQLYEEFVKLPEELRNDILKKVMIEKYYASS
jgi:hypothetical protein